MILSIIVFLGIDKYNNTTSIRLDKRNFSISDTVSINKIILENRNLEKIYLHRNQNDSKWVLNDSLVPNQYLINLLLKTLKDMKIKQPIARAALNNIIKRMAIQNTKIEIFQKNKKTKTIYVGGETPDQLGTFMMLQGAKEPYIVHIPGFNGYLSSRFSCKENLWRSKQIFNEKLTNATCLIYDIPDSLTRNLSIFNDIYCEDFLNKNKKFDPENIMQRIPFCIIEVTTESGEIKKLTCIRKKAVNKEKYKGQKYDQERFYGFVNNKLMLIQYKQFQNLILSESMTTIFTPWHNLK